MEEKKAQGTIEPAKPLALKDLVAYQQGSIVSRTLHRDQAGTLTLFAFDQGQAISEHSAPFDAFALVLEGEGEVSLAGNPTRVKTLDLIHLPKGVPHALSAPGPFKMLLVMFRDKAA